MEKIRAFLDRADKAITFALKCITIAFFIILILIVTANILLRYFPVTSFHWMDEIVELCIGGLVFYGACAAWMVGGHFSVGDWISKRMPNERGKLAYRFLVEILCLVFMAIFFRYSLQITMKTMEVTAVFQIPKKVLYSAMPISSFIMCLYSLARCVELISAFAIKKNSLNKP